MDNEEYRDRVNKVLDNNAKIEVICRVLVTAGIALGVVTLVSAIIEVL